MLASCAMQADGHLAASPSGQNPRRCGSGGGLCGALMQRLRGQICGAGSPSCGQEQEQRGISPRDHNGPVADDTVHGLSLLQTERCALAAAFAVMAKQRSDVQVGDYIKCFALTGQCGFP